MCESFRVTISSCQRSEATTSPVSTGIGDDHHRRRLFILSRPTEAQLRLYQSNVNYGSKMCLRPLNITEDILCKAQIPLSSTRHVRRVEPMHFGCVDIVKQHSSTRSTRRAPLARHVDHDWLDTTRATRNSVCCVISIKL